MCVGKLLPPDPGLQMGLRKLKGRGWDQQQQRQLTPEARALSDLCCRVSPRSHQVFSFRVTRRIPAYP